MKIVFCTDTICYRGGIQSITISKANALAEIAGNEVWVIVTDTTGETVRPLSSKVRLIDLHVRYYEYDWKSKYHVLKSIVIKRRKHKKKLETVLNQILPDIVVSTGTSEKYFIPTLKVLSHPHFIREIHFFTNYRRQNAKGIFDYMLAMVGDLWDYKNRIHRYDRIVVLTNGDKNTYWRDNDKVVVIPNFYSFYSVEVSSLDEKVVVTAGRLVPEKGFSSLINAWTIVSKKHPDWKLDIWGDGILKSVLEKQVAENGLRGIVTLRGYSPNISSVYSNASLYVMSSTNEGFGLVLVEAMSCGLPIVSYDCPFGPKDIITDGKDGFLVSLNDEVALADRINYLIENERVRKCMGKAALEKSKKYSVSSVIPQWMSLFESLINYGEKA